MKIDYKSYLIIRNKNKKVIILYIWENIKNNWIKNKNFILLNKVKEKYL